MPKIRLMEDEWYPVRTPLTENLEDFDESDIFDIDQKTLDRWREADRVFGEAQTEMSELVSKADDVRIQKLRDSCAEQDVTIYDEKTGRTYNTIAKERRLLAEAEQERREREQCYHDRMWKEVMDE